MKNFLWTDLFRLKKKDENSISAVLAKNVLFGTLTARELEYLSTMVYERVFEPGEPVFRQGDRGFGMYLIVKGRVDIATEGGERRTPITTLEPGSFFGELFLIEPDNLRSASAIATEKTTLIGFFKPDLLEILERKPSMGVKILYQLSYVLGRRLLNTTELLTRSSAGETQHVQAA